VDELNNHSDAPTGAEPAGDVTRLLDDLRAGDREAMNRLLPLIYDELRRRAHQQLMKSRVGETLNTTALVHEAYLKLANAPQQSYANRIHFFAVASRAMRQVLIDYARRTLAERRGGGEAPISLDSDDPGVAVPTRAETLVALDDALHELSALDDRLARVVELRFFGGLSVEETAGALGVSDRTVKRDWRKARAFLYQSVRRGLQH
jgi:RNA polymerase sigma-70 factor, ECF subfamily